MKQNHNNRTADPTFIDYTLVPADAGHHHDTSPWYKWDLTKFWKSIKSEAGDRKGRKRQSSWSTGINGIRWDPSLSTTATRTDISCTIDNRSFLAQAVLEPKQDNRLANRPLYKFLSQATSTDQYIINDMLKIIMIGGQSSDKSSLARAIVGKELYVSSSTSPSDKPLPIDVNVHRWTPSDQISMPCTIWDVKSVGAGAHPSIQALFFSPKSLYILVWDLAASNQQMIRKVEAGNHKDHHFCIEQQFKHNERTLKFDIQDHVMSWLDCLFSNFAVGSAILPVATVPEGMEESEVKYWCDMLQTQLRCHPIFRGELAMKLILASDGNISTVNLITREGLYDLQGTITRLGVLAPLKLQDSHLTIKVLDRIRQLRTKNRKVVSVAHLLSDFNEMETKAEDVTKALQFLSNVGEILYFGTSTTDGLLSQFIILSTKWLVSVLLCIFSPDSQCKLTETDIVKTLVKGNNSSCPIVTAPTNMWQCWEFMKRVSETAPDTLSSFLIELLQKATILWPLNIDSNPTYFVPALLDQVEPRTIVSKEGKECWQTTVCHSWLLRDRAKASLVMKIITIHLLQDLYEFNHIFNDGFFIDQIICWKTSVFVRFGQVCQPYTDVHVTLIDEASENCVDKASMGFGMMRLNVTGKGQKGLNGYNIWKGGYGSVLHSVRDSLAGFRTIRQVVCPDCLHEVHPSVASTWSWDYIKQAVNTGEARLRCGHWHHVPTSLLCGIVGIRPKDSPHFKEVHSLRESVVLVGLMCDSLLYSVGTGFVADQKHGLVVTAGHILFQHPGGARYFGLKDAVVVISVIPESGNENAALWYFAEIVGEGISHVPACVLRITQQFWVPSGETIMKGKSECSIGQATPKKNFVCEIQALKMTSTFEMKQWVRFLACEYKGALMQAIQHVKFSPDFAVGVIRDRCAYKNTESLQDSPTKSFLEEEITVKCLTIPGQCGGPFVDEQGEVIGMLYRVDSTVRQQCYLVPAKVLIELVDQARQLLLVNA